MWSNMNSEKYTVIHFSETYRLARFFTVLIAALIFTVGCAHYPFNSSLDQYNLDKGYRIRHMGAPGNSESLFLALTFSGGGTRAAAFTYGLLEELAITTVIIDGQERRLLDEVDVISSVSGGSFTSGYYGLFGDRIFEDFEDKFLKKNIQGGLIFRKYFFIPNWFRLVSPTFSSSDLAAEFYDKYVFEGGTFSDIAARKGPAILINATDMTEGTPFPFEQATFDILCSDISDVPVARAAAASSAVPVILSPISFRNYASTCEYPSEWIDRYLEDYDYLSPPHQLAVRAKNYLDPEEKPYIHVVDGGVADNLGIRAIINRVMVRQNAWNSLKRLNIENTRKVVFVVVDAAVAVDRSVDLKAGSPGIFKVLSSVSTTPLSTLNFDTLLLLQKNFKIWKEQISTGRCSDPEFKGDRDSCSDIEFSLIYVHFNALKDEEEREYFQGLPTSFKLPDDAVDKLREVSGRLLRESEEYQQLLGDLK